MTDSNTEITKSNAKRKQFTRRNEREGVPSEQASNVKLEKKTLETGRHKIGMSKLVHSFPERNQHNRRGINNKQHKESMSKLGHSFPERNQYNRRGINNKEHKESISKLGHSFLERNQCDRSGINNTKKA
jgi:hypothetical protein